MVKIRGILRGMAAVVVMAFAFSIVLPVGVAQAAMVSTDQVLADRQVSGADDRAVVDAFLARDEVRQQMEAMGLDMAEARDRLAALSDAETARLAAVIEDDPAGQGVGAVIGAILIVFLVLLATDILGFTNVYPFAEKGSAR